VERIRFRSLAEFLELSNQDQAYEYTVAWIDCLARGARLGRGLFLRGDHVTQPDAAGESNGSGWGIPFELPTRMVNRATMTVFNRCYYRSQLRSRQRRVVPYESFFFPLDKLRDWNRLYGPKGFFQYQCVVPDDSGQTVARLLDQIARSREAPALAVLKRFGDIKSPGLLSFPRPGITLAVDFPNQGVSTLRLFDQLDLVVAEAGGALYPAKDARMSGSNFRRFFPGWEAFSSQVDPKFSSSFWRRVTAAEP
jgi:FAD/FMN-containing dehydrogenase